MNGKLNKVVTIIAKIAEVFMWVGAALSLVITIVVAVGHQDLMWLFTDAAEQSVLATGGFSIVTAGLTSGQLTAAFIIFFVTTPFQPAIIRMVREIGIFCIAIPIVELIMSIIGTAIIGSEVAEISVTFGSIFVGLVVLCLSQFFAYGAQLQRDTDGLV